MSSAAIQGQITRVERRGKQIYCFEGTDLHKVGEGETIHVAFHDTQYVGELVAIAPTRAIVLISSHREDHSIRSTNHSTAATIA